ncbi:MAG: glycosyltransferase family 39 protein [Methanobrevibacter arboriphilus]|nr:glycosyltransferase family 39 protein [Methanobrevibacter arboriphilus]
MKVTKINSLINFFKSNEIKLSFLFILIFSSILTILLIWINTSQEILGTSYRDVYFYLIEALRFSGYSIGGYEYVNYLSPLIPFLTSLLFKLGFVSETSIFAVTGIFYILGVLGFFSLLRLRFRNLMAVLGSIIYAGISINMLWVANGTIDIPSISITILSIYFFVLGIEKNQKYLYLAFPLAVLGFFAKYTAGLAIPLMVLYILSKPNIILNIKKYWKNGVLGIFLGFITTIPFLAYFLINKIPFGFLNQAQNIASQTTGSTTTNSILKVGNDLFFYFTNMPRFIYSINEILAYFVIIITLIGIIIGIYKSVKFLKSRYYDSNRFNNGKFEFLNIKFLNIKISNKLIYILFIVNIIIILLSFLTASKISFVYSELIFFISAFTLSYIVNKIINIKNIDSEQKYDKFSFDLLMFAWFFSYLIFFSAHLVKADRYFTTMAPGFVFIFILALNLILNSFDSITMPNIINKMNFNSNTNISNATINNTNIANKDSTKNKNNKNSNINIKANKNLIKSLIPIALIVLFIISSFTYLDMNKHDSLVHNEREAVEWIKIHIPDYQNEIIWSERGPTFTWYLKQEIFYVNWKYSPNKLSEMMIGNNTTYFISISPETNIPGFSPVKKFGEVIIYQRDSR